MELTDGYFDSVITLMERLRTEERDSIDRAATAVADTIEDGRLLHVFGTGGHSAMGAEEVFFRAGGLMAVNAILDDGVMLQGGAFRSMYIERTPGYAKAVLDWYEVNEGDVLLIVNAYGINAVTIESALEGRTRGCTTIAVTSVDLQRELPAGHASRHPDGHDLADLVDIVVDCKVPMGDALVSVPSVSQKVGASSTFLNALALNLITLNAIGKLAARGINPPIWQSANSPGGDEANRKNVADFKRRIKKL